MVYEYLDIKVVVGIAINRFVLCRLTGVQRHYFSSAMALNPTFRNHKMKTDYSLDQFKTVHARVIPTSFEERVRFFAAAGMDAGQITDRIFITDRYQDGGVVGSQARAERTAAYYNTLHHVNKELSKIENERPSGD